MADDKPKDLHIENWSVGYKEDQINANIIADNINQEVLKNTKNGETFEIDLTGGEIKELYKKLGKDFKPLAVRTIQSLLGVLHQGVWTPTKFGELRTKIVDNVDIDIKELKPKHEDIPKTFNCVVLGVDQRK